MQTRHRSIERPFPMDLAQRELERTGASSVDMQKAAAFLASSAGPRAYEALSAPMRRLVDLLTVGAAPADDRSAARPMA